MIRTTITLDPKTAKELEWFRKELGYSRSELIRFLWRIFRTYVKVYLDNDFKKITDCLRRCRLIYTNGDQDRCEIMCVFFYVEKR